MSTVELDFCELPITPDDFDKEKFLAGDPEQLKLYKSGKSVRKKKLLTIDEVLTGRNYARFVPEGCCFIDYDDMEQAKEMQEIILRAKLRCLILNTQHGKHFLFRMPDFYKREMTKATNWFGYKFDVKGTKKGTPLEKAPVQIMRVCGMERQERMSWELTSGPIISDKMSTDSLDILPYWLWGKLSDKDLHKKGRPGESEYHLDDTPFTQLMTLTEGSRHDHIVTRCSHFALTNGFEIDEFKDLIRAIHDQYLVKIGSPMPDSDLFGDLEKRWDEYYEGMESSDWSYDEKERVWVKSKSKDKLDERRAAEKVFEEYDFYVKDRKVDGTGLEILYREKDASYDYKRDLTKIRESVRGFTEQNFKKTFLEEVEVQIMQLCAENNKTIKRSHQYVISKDKVMSCLTSDVYDFSWLGKRPPTDVVLPFTWESEEWVEEHEKDLGKLINKFMAETARNSSGKTDPIVEQWLWVVAGAAMIPANQLEKIVIMSGGGRNGKSLYTSLIRLCLGGDMFNMSKIFDNSPQDSFWGGGLDKGILCVVDDMPRAYNRDAFSYIKGAVTKTDKVEINEKYKPKKTLDVLPQIIACTNFDFELYDKSEGMRRRVLILPTEYEVPVEERDRDLEFKLVLATDDPVRILNYQESDRSPDTGELGELCMHMYTREKGVLNSLNHGSLAWFANKARYMYFKWLRKEILVEGRSGSSSSAAMTERFEGTFSGGYDAELIDFLDWYVTEIGESTWVRELYISYMDWHNDANSSETPMKEKTFGMKLRKAVSACAEKGYNLELKKKLNDKRISMLHLFIYKEEEE